MGCPQCLWEVIGEEVNYDGRSEDAHVSQRIGNLLCSQPALLMSAFGGISEGDVGVKWKKDGVQGKQSLGIDPRMTQWQTLTSKPGSSIWKDRERTARRRVDDRINLV
jgi:hypothetical protein